MDSKAQQFSLPDSSRLSGLAPHTIWLFRLDAKIAELRAAGADIINLGVGNPDQPTHPDVVAAGQLALADPANHRYPDQTGTPQQVRRVIDAVRDHDVPAVFCESTVNTDPAEQVARETGARFGGVLYVDSLSEPDGPVPTYLDLLRVTTETVATGLGARP